MHKGSQLKRQHLNRGGEESHTEVKIENLPMIFDDDCMKMKMKIKVFVLLRSKDFQMDI